MRHWILKGHEPVEAGMMEWAEWFESAPNRRVAVTEGGDYTISTVFLGVDHRFVGDGPPLLFETMVFDKDGGGDTYRYSTWDEAEAGHAAVVEEWREKAARERGGE